MMTTLLIIFGTYFLSGAIVAWWLYSHYNDLYMSEKEMLRHAILMPVLNTLLAIFMIIQLMVKEDERGSDE